MFVCLVVRFHFTGTPYKTVMGGNLKKMMIRKLPASFYSIEMTKKIVGFSAICVATLKNKIATRHHNINLLAIWHDDSMKLHIYIVKLMVPSL